MTTAIECCGLVCRIGEISSRGAQKLGFPCFGLIGFRVWGLGV